MKKKCVKFLCLSLFLTFVVTNNFAQKKGKTTTKKTTGGSAYSTPASSGSSYSTPPASSSSAGSAYGTPAPSSTGASNSGAASAYGQQPPSTSGAAKAKQQYDPKIPFVYKKGAGGGLGDSVKNSLRNDNTIDRQLIKERLPLAYDPIREDDAIYRQKLTIEVDTREKLNQLFRYSADENNGNQRFISILLNAIQNDSVVAFDADDDRFTTPYSVKQIMAKVLGGNDTNAVTNLDNPDKIDYYSVSPKQVNPDSIYKFRIKEEMVFDKEASKLYRRILGICPIMPYYNTAGIKMGDLPMFWIYYPDIRKSLSKFEVYNPKNIGARMTWEDFLENHMFSYYILKCSMDNVKNQELSQYITDPKFRLFEGEKIKEKIFNYEQGLWAY